MALTNPTPPSPFRNGWRLPAVADPLEQVAAPLGRCLTFLEQSVSSADRSAAAPADVAPNRRQASSR